MPEEAVSSFIDGGHIEGPNVLESYTTTPPEHVKRQRSDLLHQQFPIPYMIAWREIGRRAALTYTEDQLGCSTSWR